MADLRTHRLGEQSGRVMAFIQFQPVQQFKLLEPVYRPGSCQSAVDRWRNWRKRLRTWLYRLVDELDGWARYQLFGLDVEQLGLQYRPGADYRLHRHIDSLRRGL